MDALANAYISLLQSVTVSITAIYSIMSGEGPSKRPFGLSFPSKPKAKSTTTTITPINKSCLAAAAFSLDDDDDMDTTTNTSSRPPVSSRSILNVKAQRDIEQALEEDPNIYEYDEVYEQVSSTVQQEQKREEKKRLERETNVTKQPKYVAGLLEKSKVREKEYEKVQERRIQRDRELEGDLYADKEVFVTSAYKAKLAERQAEFEREKLEDQREAMLNVHNQDNMDAFYRFQFKVRTGLKKEFHYELNKLFFPL
jgi:coiled-coil domain-containing protein 55